MKVKIFEELRIDKLEEKINSFLKELGEDDSKTGKSERSIDIKYQTVFDPKGVDGMLYSAMVIYS